MTTDNLKTMFADLDALLADMEAGKPVECSPEIRALAKKVAAQEAAHANDPPMTEEEMRTWAARMAKMICTEDE